MCPREQDLPPASMAPLSEARESSKAYKRSCKETINRSPTTTLRVSLVEQVPRLGQDLLALHHQRDHLLLLLPPKQPLPHPMHLSRLLQMTLYPVMPGLQTFLYAYLCTFRVCAKDKDLGRIFKTIRQTDKQTG